MSPISPEELADFFDFLRFPSISARPEHAGDVRDCAVWLAEWLSRLGLEAAVRETAGAPAVVAKNSPRPDRPTLLLYGHYDVQPVEPRELWKSGPFESEIRDGFVYARGATDNKGQTFAHLIGLRRLLTRGELPVNLIFLMEGEEEIGSPHLEKFLREHREEFACDVALISDTSMIAPGWPALTLGLRGIACFEITIDGPRADLHSGMFGGVTPNPASALCRILARLHAVDGAIAIPRFYENVREPDAEELSSWTGLPWDDAWFARTTGGGTNAGELGRSLLERVWSRPTAEINGLTSGHQGAGSKTIIPARASAKVSFRLVPDQDPDTVAALVTAWFESQFSREGVRGTAIYDHGGRPFHTPPDNPCLHAARRALARVFGKDPALTREGLSIPVATLLQSELKVPVILAGLGLPDCQAHAPNESFPLENLERGAALFEALVAEFCGLSAS